ncbi:hypothetical protein BU16DRAFT_227299 [Lophium mytilinum]|uniref:F-box domain-containing protein n=1 Tax=Lophium mytilinum TaxID=390894 RepID=A0A6A6Q8Y8_9PEZI|nr:hypothetical protein BU16DRAFT_227299 [Lophium mytilinum]
MVSASPADPGCLSLQPSSRLSFLSLPRELRDIVYQHALQSRRSAGLSRLWLHHMRSTYYPLTILLLNRQIKEEFIAVAAKHIGIFVLDVEEASTGSLVDGKEHKLVSYFPFEKRKIKGSNSRSGLVEFDPLWFKYVPRLRISATIFRGEVDDKNEHLLKYDRLKVVEVLVERYKLGLLEEVKELEVQIVASFVVKQEWIWKWLEPLKELPMLKSICVRRPGPEAWWFKEV